MTEATALFWDPRCLKHDVPPGFPEMPKRLSLAVPYLGERWPMVDVSLAADGVEQASPMRSKARELAARVHAPAYLERLEASAAAGDAKIDTDDNPLSSGTVDAAWAAVEVALAAGDHMMLGHDRRAFALARPPGHHCEHDRAMGFCYLNQIAILAQGLIDIHGAERIAILDFDVHHGNGTQHLFDERSDVMFASVHQFPFYPGTGAASETGLGEGQGTTVNTPLPAGSGDEQYQQVFEQRLLPEVEKFSPDVLLVSAGFDAWRNDPLGGMDLSEDCFHWFGIKLAELASELCQGRLTSILEGGYDLDALPGLIDAYARGTAGVGALESG